MAPWPQQGNEPKAPDRNKTSDNRTFDNLKSKSEPPEDKKLIKGSLKEDQSEAKKKDVHSLDDGQLKALLDEAIQYKNPKDREGKSKIFRVSMLCFSDVSFGATFGLIIFIFEFIIKSLF